MKLLFQDGETFANYNTVLEEYRQALRTREEVIDRLYLEIKIIKKLRV